MIFLMFLKMLWYCMTKLINRESMNSLFITVVAIRDCRRGVTRRNFSQSLGIRQGRNGNWQCLCANCRVTEKNLEKKVIFAEMCSITRRLLVFGQIGKIYEAKQSAKREMQVN
jgi:hypothetical protein